MVRHTVFALSLLALGCAPSNISTDTAADDQALRARFETLNQAASAQNDSLIASLFEEDGISMPPGAPRVMGRANIRMLWAANWPLKPTLVVTPASFTVSGDWAYGEGTYTWSATTPAGEQQDHGKFMDVWHRVDGMWMLHRDIWNSDVPPPAAPVTPKRN